MYKWVFILLFFASCTTERKIARFIKYVPAKDVATYIARNYPEYLRADTITYRDTITKEVEIFIPAITHDTIYDTDTISDYSNYHYRDNILKLDINRLPLGKIKLDYKIYSRTVKDTVIIYVEKSIPCPPCPTETIVQYDKTSYEKQLISVGDKLSFYRKLSLFLLVAIAGYFIVRFVILPRL